MTALSPLPRKAHSNPSKAFLFVAPATCSSLVTAGGHLGLAAAGTPILLPTEEGSSFGRGYPLLRALRAVP